MCILQSLEPICGILTSFWPMGKPIWANGQMTMTAHNYRPRQFCRISNGENPSSSYRNMGSVKKIWQPRPWWQYSSSPGDWGVKSMVLTKPVCSVVMFTLFCIIQNTGLLLNIMLIFDRCHHSWAAVTPFKYEHDWKNVTGNLQNK